MKRENNLIDFMFICFFWFSVAVFLISYFKGEILYNGFVTEGKYVKYTDSFDVFRFYFSIGSSFDCQCSVLFRRFAFDTIFIHICIKYISIYLYLYIFV